MDKFKTGDKVIVRDSGSRFDGKHGVIMYRHEERDEDGHENRDYVIDVGVQFPTYEPEGNLEDVSA